eukprot:gene38463-33289_t
MDLFWGWRPDGAVGGHLVTKGEGKVWALRELGMMTTDAAAWLLRYDWEALLDRDEDAHWAALRAGLAAARRAGWCVMGQVLDLDALSAAADVREAAAEGYDCGAGAARPAAPRPRRAERALRPLLRKAARRA